MSARLPAPAFRPAEGWEVPVVGEPGVDGAGRGHVVRSAERRREPGEAEHKHIASIHLSATTKGGVASRGNYRPVASLTRRRHRAAHNTGACVPGRVRKRRVRVHSGERGVCAGVLFEARVLRGVRVGDDQLLPLPREDAEEGSGGGGEDGGRGKQAQGGGAPRCAEPGACGLLAREAAEVMSSRAPAAGGRKHIVVQPARHDEHAMQHLYRRWGVASRRPPSTTVPRQQEAATRVPALLSHACFTAAGESYRHPCVVIIVVLLGFSQQASLTRTSVVVSGVTACREHNKKTPTAPPRSVGLSENARLEPKLSCVTVWSAFCADPKAGHTLVHVTCFHHCSEAAATYSRGI